MWALVVADDLNARVFVTQTLCFQHDPRTTTYHRKFSPVTCTKPGELPDS